MQVYALYHGMSTHDTRQNLDTMYKDGGKVPGIQRIGPLWRGSAHAGTAQPDRQPPVDLDPTGGGWRARIWAGVTPLHPAQTAIV